MEHRKEFSVRKFEFWGGGKDWCDKFKEKDKLDVLESEIKAAFEGTVPTETDINDYVWFDERLHELLNEDEEDDTEDGDEGDEEV